MFFSKHLAKADGPNQTNFNISLVEKNQGRDPLCKNRFIIRIYLVNSMVFTICIFPLQIGSLIIALIQKKVHFYYNNLQTLIYHSYSTTI